jgi:hypothetical protein
MFSVGSTHDFKTLMAGSRVGKSPVVKKFYKIKKARIVSSKPTTTNTTFLHNSKKQSKKDYEVKKFTYKKMRARNSNRKFRMGSA